jgi:hypothetical protein
MTTTNTTFRIRNLSNGRLVSRGHTNLSLVCGLIFEAGSRGERWAWEAE